MLNIQKLHISKIMPAKWNPRKDLKPGDTEYKKLRKSLIEFGCVDPLIWNKRSGNLIGGHQRLKVLQELGYTELDVSVVDLPDNKEKALNVALNKISGEWDMPLLKDLLAELDTGGFDLEISGFDAGEMEKLMTQFNPLCLEDNATEERKDVQQYHCPKCGFEFEVSGKSYQL